MEPESPAADQIRDGEFSVLNGNRYSGIKEKRLIFFPKKEKSISTEWTRKSRANPRV